MLDRNRVIEYVAHIAVNSDDAVGSMEGDCCDIKKVFLVFGEEKPLFLKGQRCVIMVDNLIFRFLAITAASVINTMIRLAFYGLLKLELPVLASGRVVAATIVFDLFAKLFASVLLYIALDRVFNKGLY